MRIGGIGAGHRLPQEITVPQELRTLSTPSVGTLQTNDPQLGMEWTPSHSFNASVTGTTQRDNTLVALTLDGVRAELIVPAGTPASAIVVALAEEFQRLTGFVLSAGGDGNVGYIDEGFPGFERTP
jgi:hypothetical protein